MSDVELRGPWGVIYVKDVLVEGPLGETATAYVHLERYYLNGEPISQDEARRLIESTRPEGERP